MMRSLLYEAAQVMMTRVKKWSRLKAWAMNVAKRCGPPKGDCRAGAPISCHHAPHVGPTAQSSAGRTRSLRRSRRLGAPGLQKGEVAIGVLPIGGKMSFAGRWMK